MRKQEIKKLYRWYERHKRMLPWRATGQDRADPYHVWVSEIMLQQTQVATVKAYFIKFMRRYPTVKDLAKAKEQDVLKLWEGLGYYRRARSLLLGARQVVARENGFPKCKSEWLEIAGVGPYTAGAIASIALDHAEPIVDGNVERIWARFYRLKRNRPKDYQNQLWNYSTEFIQNTATLRLRPSHLNQALMELGALVCTLKNPNCMICPLAERCEARMADVVERFPQKLVKKPMIEMRERRVAIVSQDAFVLLEPSARWSKGTYDLPERALSSHLKQMSPLAIFRVKSTVTNHRITREVQVFRISKRTRGIRISKGQVWEPLGNSIYPLPSLGLKSLKMIKNML